MTLFYEEEGALKLPFDCQALAREVINGALEYIHCPYEVQVNLLLTMNDEIHEMNRDFRNIDRATDVLSFPMLEYETPGDFSHFESEEDCFDPETGELLLGDIVISMEKAVEQADRFGHTLQREVGYLTAHSMLHLLGYDHEEPLEKVHMREKEELVMTQLGLPSTTSYVLNSDEE